MQNTATTQKAMCDALIDELVTISARIAAAEYRKLVLIREIEDTILLAFDPFPQWLAWRLGIELSTAYERIRVARALASLPVISAAFAEGHLSYSKVRLIARVATPVTDAKYAKLALAGGVRYLTAVVRQHAEIMHVHNEDAEHRRYFQVTAREDGMFEVRGCLSADEGAILMKALEAAKSTSNADNCDAVTQVATAAIDRLATGDDVILHVHNDEHICAVEGHACARATADRLICQNPNNRTASATQVRALKAIQGGVCAYPTCTHARHLHAHHVVHWSAGGRTTIDNLVLICSRHHRLLHEGRYSLTREGNDFVFRNQHGLVVGAAGELRCLAGGERDLATTVRVLVDSWDGDDPENRRDCRNEAIEWLLER